MIVEWDDEKALSNKRKHGVSFDEAVSALEDRLSNHVPGPGPLARRRTLPDVRTWLIRAYPYGGSHGSWGRRSADRPGGPHALSDSSMKKASEKPFDDDIRPEYDLASLGPGVRGKYAGRLKGTTLVALRPEVAEAFPTAKAVNEALRAVMKATAVMRRSTPSRARSVGGKRS